MYYPTMWNKNCSVESNMTLSIQIYMKKTFGCFKFIHLYIYYNMNLLSLITRKLCVCFKFTQPFIYYHMNQLSQITRKLYYNKKQLSQITRKLHYNLNQLFQTNRKLFVWFKFVVIININDLYTCEILTLEKHRKLKSIAAQNKAETVVQ